MIETMTPSGVEHLDRHDIESIARQVIETMTPSGVEHVARMAIADVLARVIETMTPSGVEHIMHAMRERARPGDRDDDAFGR